MEIAKQRPACTVPFALGQLPLIKNQGHIEGIRPGETAQIKTKTRKKTKTKKTAFHVGSLQSHCVK